MGFLDSIKESLKKLDPYQEYKEDVKRQVIISIWINLFQLSFWFSNSILIGVRCMDDYLCVSSHLFEQTVSNSYVSLRTFIHSFISILYGSDYESTF